MNSYAATSTWRPACQAIGFRTIRPYVTNAMRRPSTALKIMGVTSRYLTCTPTNTRLSTAKTAAARIVSDGCQWNAAGTMSPTVHASSKIPRVIHAPRGNAPKEGTSLLTLSNMKTFMTPDDPYRSAARTCRTHNSMLTPCTPGFRSILTKSIPILSSSVTRYSLSGARPNFFYSADEG